MKVDNLQVGNIYFASKKTEVLKNPILKHHIRWVKLDECPEERLTTYKNLPYGVEHTSLWYHPHTTLDFGIKTFMYLGYTREKWSLSFARNKIYKHHWFLFKGKKVILDNYCMRFLESTEE